MLTLLFGLIRILAKNHKMRALLLLYFFSLSISIQAQSWQITPLPNMPESVTNNAVCEGFIGDTAFVFTFGGLDSTKIYSGIHQRSHRYNTITQVWSSIPDLPDNSGKIASGASRIGDIIYIIAGYHVLANGNEISSKKIHRYQISTNTFLTDGADIPKAIDDHVQAVWKDSLIYVITGWSNSTNVPNVQIYNPSLDTWTQGNYLPSSSYKSFGASGTIIGDTIYYFGGARIANNFPIQKDLRMGVIDVNNPSQISWSSNIPDQNIAGYRMASTSVKGQPIWIGGSAKTYNYNGIAYDGSGGITPNNRSFLLHNSNWNILYNTLPMDLRGIASANDTTKYIVGGMIDNQQVTNQFIRLTWHQNIVNTLTPKQPSAILRISPNPAQEVIHISFAQAIHDTNFIIYIFNQSGQVVLSQKITQNNQEVNISHFPKGNYIITLKSQTATYSNTFHKK